MKKKIHAEYPLKPSSGSVIWNAISTPAGLEHWFADKVTKTDKRFTFQWGKTETREAEIINSRSEYFIRFHWLDEEESKTYFELKMQYNELTNDYMIEVTDFADPGEENDMRELWNSQIETLRRVFGL